VIAGPRRWRPLVKEALAWPTPFGGAQICAQQEWSIHSRRRRARGSDDRLGVLQYAQSRRAHEPARFGLRAGKPCRNGWQEMRATARLWVKSTR